MLPADFMHSSMIRTTSVLGSSGIFTLFVRTIFKRKRDDRLVQKFHGIEFDSPVGLAAGFDKSGEIVPAIAALGFGFGTVGSVTAKKCAGNPRPWFYRLPKTKSLVVNAGLANDGSLVVINRLKNYGSKATGGFPIVLSVAKTNHSKVVDTKDAINDYVTTLKRAKNEKSIKIFEVNISCPNAYGGEPFTTPERLEKLLSAVDEVGLKKPIFIKMPVDLDWKNFKKLLDVAVKHKVAGVTVANLAKDRSKVELKDVLPDSVRGNLSGKPAYNLSNELIRRTYLNYGKKLTIIGVGGIFTAEDAYVKIRLGASLVEIITGLIFNGPQLAAEINDGLIRLLEKDGYTHISQAIGVDAKK